MGGFLGIGGSSANTDRGNQLAATQGDWNLYSQGLNTGTAQQAAGQQTLGTALNTLGPAQNYFQNLLTAGRTDTAASSAPAINAQLAGSDATRNQQAQFGTGRTGGGVAASQSAGTASQSNIDNIINTNLNTGRQAGAQGLTSVAGLQGQIASTQLSNALQQFGLSESAVNSILNNSTASRSTSYGINQNQQEQYGNLAGAILLSLGI